MATSPEFVRVASSAARSLTESAFDAVREALVVVDARAKDALVVLGNAVASGGPSLSSIEHLPLDRSVSDEGLSVGCAERQAEHWPRLWVRIVGHLESPSADRSLLSVRCRTLRHRSRRRSNSRTATDGSNCP